MSQHVDFTIKSKILNAVKTDPLLYERLGNFADVEIGRPHINPTPEEVNFKCNFLTLQNRLQR